MTELTKTLAIALALGLTAAPAAFAQDAATPAPAADTAAPAADATATPAAPADATAPAAAAPAAPTQAAPEGPGTPYVLKTEGDWTLRCFRTEDGNDPCEVYQLLKDANGNNIADISIVSLPDGGQAVAGATIMTPLDTMLPPGVAIKIDTAEAKAYPFMFCAPPGCFVRYGMTAAELDSLKKGNSATVAVVPLSAPNQKVEVKMSLKGFTAAFAELGKTGSKAPAQN
ncbi:MAG: invasion associated locus B family protein [Paenirhodobacter sp.]|uniref:invasion associated locus B family protein n=1 Tax=Paenirhodobacter sp. TaxID=1965326 RepID=UPI003D0A5ACD